MISSSELRKYLELDIPPHILRINAGYRASHFISSCDCNDAKCRRRRKRGYGILVMDLGAAHTVSWWLSQN